jgi:anthranilate phosphoribosyltransferase
MSDEFRELLKKVGSGTHTGKNLSRSEAADATMMMLQQEATPAQIGAFIIAHRIKRPTPEELAGILDAYDCLGQKLDLTQNSQQKSVVFGNPYDGRAKTVPVTIITALMLAAVEVRVIMHGGDCMPTKYGIPLIEIWQQLGVDFSGFSISQTQTFLDQTAIALVYLPQHFPEAHSLVPYREQIGKRPPFASAELIWCPIIGQATLVAGFVHPPTEERFLSTFQLRGIKDFITVKGLEGSCDLPRSRTAIIGIGQQGRDFEHLFIHPVDYGLNGIDLAFEFNNQAIAQINSVIQGKNSPLTPSAILNGGFYLWRFGVCPDLTTGLSLAEEMLVTGKVKQKLEQLQKVVSG